MPIDIDSVLECWGIAPARVRLDIPIPGSPERSLGRNVIEDGAGRLWLLERLDPRAAARKQEIAEAVAFIGTRMAEAKPYLAYEPGRFVLEREDFAWQVSPYVSGLALDRPGFAFEAWRGGVLAGLAARLREAVKDMPNAASGQVLPLDRFIGDLTEKVRLREPALFVRLGPAVGTLREKLFPRLAALPKAFCHGDFHPLNMIWSGTGVEALIDWEFCGPRPEMYDAALLVGCLGMEDPRALEGGLVRELVSGLRARAGYAAESWQVFPELVLALRFAWLSDWLRRGDAEMVDLETVFIGLLCGGRAALERAWA